MGGDCENKKEGGPPGPLDKVLGGETTSRCKIHSSLLNGGGTSADVTGMLVL